MRQPPRPIVKNASGMQERCAWFPNICVKIYLLMLFKCIAGYALTLRRNAYYSTCLSSGRGSEAWKRQE